MPLDRFRLADFRCIRAAELALDSSLTLITGPNGAGKTSLLEAIYLLGRGRSFRTAELNHLVRNGAERATVVGDVSKEARLSTVGVEIVDNGLLARIGGRNASSLAELSVLLPVQVIEPGVHKLIEEGPQRRRRFLDWGVFHVEPRFLESWQRFHRALRQRNAALKHGASDDALRVWTDELLASGHAVHGYRAAYVAAITSHLAEAVESLMGESLQITYKQGWPADESLEAALTRSLPGDRQRGATGSGPHRADLVVRRLSGAARNSVSRGQQKLLAAALVIGQLRYHSASSGLLSTLLLDDPAAELDAERLKGFVAEVQKLRAQLVITALHDDFRPWAAAGRLFHVEQGGEVRMI
jgi:DNA replication and repair protein RecF